MRTIKQNEGWFAKPLPAPPHFTAPGETQILLQLASEVEGDILEIGCNVGHTTLNFALRFPMRKIYAVDWIENTNKPTLPDGANESEVAKHALHMPNVIPHNGDSRIYKYPDGIGFIYIDANHQYDYVRVDTMKALAYAADKVVTIMWHDVYSKCEDGPTRVLKELPPEFDVMHIEGTMLAVLKINQDQ